MHLKYDHWIFKRLFLVGLVVAMGTLLALIGRRMAERRNHFMPTSLLDSQFATLEAPQADEHPLNISIDAEPDAIVATIVAQLALKPTA